MITKKQVFVEDDWNANRGTVMNTTLFALFALATTASLAACGDDESDKRVTQNDNELLVNSKSDQETMSGRYDSDGYESTDVRGFIVGDLQLLMSYEKVKSTMKKKRRKAKIINEEKVPCLKHRLDARLKGTVIKKRDCVKSLRYNYTANSGEGYAYNLYFIEDVPENMNRSILIRIQFFPYYGGKSGNFGALLRAAKKRYGQPDGKLTNPYLRNGVYYDGRASDGFGRLEIRSGEPISSGHHVVELTAGARFVGSKERAMIEYASRNL